MNQKLLALLCSVLFSTAAFSQTAPDFTALDCETGSHHLYAELSTGKVIVLCFVMPCSTCILPSLTAYNVCQSYSSSHPDTVLFYLIDDAGNTPCTTLNGWADNNNIGPNRTTFSTTNILETNYGGTGMPHVVVVGANAHEYFNELNAAAGNAVNLQAAINAALAATAIQEISGGTFQLSAVANSQTLNVNYSLASQANAVLEIINETGQLVQSRKMGKQPAGSYHADMNLQDFAGGIYFVCLNTETISQSVKFILSK